MRWKISCCPFLLSMCCLASLKWTCAAVTSATEPVSAEVEGTTEAEIPEKWEWPKPCYVEKSKVDELIVQLNSTVRFLNPADSNMQCRQKLEAVLVEADGIEICSEERIHQIQQDLFKVTGSLFQLAVRLTQPPEEEIDYLDLQKFRLHLELQALKVFYGPPPCEGYSMALFPFQHLVQKVKESVDKAYRLIRPSKPTRSPPLTTPAPPTTTTKPTAEDMLNPEKSLGELTEMARLNPAAMSKAVPQIISQRYNERNSTFDKLLTFVQDLPAEENIIFGFSAVYHEMHRYNRNPESYKLVKFATSFVDHLNMSASTTVNAVARSKLADLVHDADLSPSMMRSRHRSYSELTELARSNPTAMSKALPQIVSQRYGGKAENFDAILSFVEGLPTTENKVFGFSALYDDIRRSSSGLDVSKLVKLAKNVISLNETASSSPKYVGTVASSKLADLAGGLILFTNDKTECHATNVAYGTQLTADEYGWPDSAYVFQDQQVLRIYSKIKADKLLFCILLINHRYPENPDYPLFASDTNRNTDSQNIKYQTKASERYVLRDNPRDLPTNAEIDWKLDPVPAKANQFRILSAKYDDFMFAHKSATGFEGWRRVLLGRKSYSDHDHISNADVWEFNCWPGNYTISSRLENLNP